MTDNVCVPHDDLLELLEDGVDDYWITSESGARIVETLRALLTQPVASEPVAEVSNKYGDPAAFAERELRIDDKVLQRLPIGVRLFSHPPAQAVPEGWIPVSERLPKYGQNVLVEFFTAATGNSQYTTATLHRVKRSICDDFPFDDRWYVTVSSGHELRSVNRWMSLPAASQPTEGSTDHFRDVRKMVKARNQCVSDDGKCGIGGYCKQCPHQENGQ